MPKSKSAHRDANQRAKHVVDIATGEEPRPEKNPSAVALGSLGGKARAQKLTPKKRSAIAKKGAQKRWGKKGKRG